MRVQSPADLFHAFKRREALVFDLHSGFVRYILMRFDGENKVFRSFLAPAFNRFCFGVLVEGPVQFYGVEVLEVLAH